MSSNQTDGPRPDQATSSSNQSQGRGNQGRGGRGGRGRSNQGRGQRQNQPKFEGQESLLKECIFDYAHDAQSKKYLKNIELLVGYVGTKFPKYNMIFQRGIENLEIPPPQRPEIPEDESTMTMLAVEQWKMEFKQIQEQEVAIGSFKSSLCSLLLGQSTPVLKDKLKAHASFESIQTSRDGIELLKLIKSITFTYDSDRVYTGMAMDKVRADFYTMKRHPGQSIQAFYEAFTAKVKIMRELGVVLCDPTYVNEIAKKNERTTAEDADREEAEERMIANRFIRACGVKEYEAHLHNSFLDGNTIHPTTLANARAIIDARMVRRDSQQNNNNNNNQNQGQGTGTGVAFVAGNSNASEHGSSENSQNASSSEGSRSNAICTDNHYSVSHIFAASTLSQDNVPPHWVLLDSQATVSIFSNKKLITNITKVATSMTIRGLCGKRTTNLQAQVKNYGTVWYDPGGWVNILSMHQVKRAHSIHFNSVKEDEFIVRAILTGEVTDIFRPSPEGLYYTSWPSAPFTHGSVLVSTVKDNKTSYSKQDIKRAEAVRQLQAKIGRPNTREFITILDAKMINNCPYTSKDIKIAESLFGPDIGTLKGKTVRSKPTKVHTEEIKECRIPAEYQDVTLGMDVMHVNGVGFLVTVSRNIKFGTIDVISSTQDSEIVQSIKKVVSTYRRGGLRPKIILADGAFDTTEINNALGLLGIKLNPTSREEHVGDIERYIRTIKERMRCVYNTLPFSFVPRIMVMELGKFAVYWLNSFPAKNGISDRSSPRLLVTGEDINFHKHCQYEFGQYVQVHEPHNNTMQPRTVGAIALRPTGNKQGGYYFMSLVTGRILNRAKATILPMPEGIEKRVAALTATQDQYPELAFGNRDNRITMVNFEDLGYNEDDDEDYVVHEDFDEVLRYDDEFIAEELADVQDDEPVGEDIVADDYVSDGDGEDEGVLDGLEDEEPEEHGLNDEEGDNVVDNVASVDHHVDDHLEPAPEPNSGPTTAPNAEAHQMENASVQNQEDTEEIIEQFMEQATADDEMANNNNEAPEVETDSNEPDMETARREPSEGPTAAPSGDDANRASPPQHQYNLRTNRERNYAHRYHGDIYVSSSTVQDLSTPQMSMKQGVRLFGDAGVAAVKTEVVQLHEREVIRAIQKSSLTPGQIREALGYLMFLKRKRNGKIKGRGCADGRKQRAYIAKEDATSPTVSTDAVFITAIIDAMEGRCVTVVDIPGAFMQVMMDKGVHMRITGLMATLLIEIDSSYKQFVVYEHGKPVIYVELLRALYGTLRAARLFWERLSAEIKEWGFIINPYDSCVANKVINGSQCTITWHIDDLKKSHKEDKVVSDIVDQIKHSFGQLGEISVSEGKRHDYLGMYLDYTEPGVLIVDMRSYIQNALDEMPKQFKGKAVTPAAQHLLQ